MMKWPAAAFLSVRQQSQHPSSRPARRLSARDGIEGAAHLRAAAPTTDGDPAQRRMSFPTSARSSTQLRRDDDLVTVDAPVDPHLEVAEIHRRVIAAGGPALLFTNVKGSPLPARHQSVRHGAARRAGIRRPAAAPDPAARASSPRRCCRRRRRSCGTRATSARELLKVGTRRVAARPRHRAGHDRRASRPAAGAHVLARGRRSVHHAAARLHDASRSARAQPRHVPDAGARRAPHRHALADRQGRRLSLRRGGGARPDACRPRCSSADRRR